MEKDNWKRRIFAVTNRHLCEGGEEEFHRLKESVRIIHVHCC